MTDREQEEKNNRQGNKETMGVSSVILEITQIVLKKTHTFLWLDQENGNTTCMILILILLLSYYKKRVMLSLI